MDFANSIKEFFKVSKREKVKVTAASEERFREFVTIYASDIRGRRGKQRNYSVTIIYLIN